MMNGMMNSMGSMMGGMMGMGVLGLLFWLIVLGLLVAVVVLLFRLVSSRDRKGGGQSPGRGGSTG